MGFNKIKWTNIFKPKKEEEIKERNEIKEDSKAKSTRSNQKEDGNNIMNLKK